MDDTRNHYLIAAAVLNGLAALLHLACIAFGPAWYRFFGAGEKMARMAAAGNWYPTIVTTFIAGVLATWALYALAGAGAIPKLPFTRGILCAITAVYLLRGAIVLPIAAFASRPLTAFSWWSSAICFCIGIVHLAGLRRAWERI